MTKDCLYSSSADIQVRRIFIQTKPPPQADELLLIRTEEYKKVRRDSDGRLVRVGSFDSGGVVVDSDTPDDSDDGLGVSFSRRA